MSLKSREMIMGNEREGGWVLCSEALPALLLGQRQMPADPAESCLVTQLLPILVAKIPASVAMVGRDHLKV